jgi:hypothetical protein
LPSPSPNWPLAILSLTGPASSSAALTQEADEMMNPQTYQPDGDQLVSEHDHAVPEVILMEPTAHPGADLAADPAADPAEPATSTASEHRGFILGGGGAAEPGMPDTSHGSPSLASVPSVAPESVPDSRASGDIASAEVPWNEIKAMFVDDPRASIERAAGLVDDRVEELVASVRERQHSMRSAWQANHAGTEELRVALQHYRTFWNSLEDLPAQA